MIPNALGIVLLIVQIIVWIHFYNKKKDSEEKENLITPTPRDDEKVYGNKL